MENNSKPINIVWIYKKQKICAYVLIYFRKSWTISFRHVFLHFNHCLQLDTCYPSYPSFPPFSLSNTILPFECMFLESARMYLAESIHRTWGSPPLQFSLIRVSHRIPGYFQIGLLVHLARRLSFFLPVLDALMALTSSYLSLG